MPLTRLGTLNANADIFDNIDEQSDISVSTNNQVTSIVVTKQFSFVKIVVTGSVTNFFLGVNTASMLDGYAIFVSVVNNTSSIVTMLHSYITGHVAFAGASSENDYPISVEKEIVVEGYYKASHDLVYFTPNNGIEA
jgi:hypothetical protein